MMKVQDAFLNRLRKGKIPVNIFLSRGTKLTGIIKYYDQFTIVLESEGNQQLIYKHSVATVVPLKPVGDIFTEEEA